MIVNFIIGALIFAYAGWSLYKFIKQSKEGKCAGCSELKNCEGPSCSRDQEKK